MSNVSKKDLIAKIQKRFGGGLPRRDIRDAVAALLEVVEADLIADRAISVHNFGTLSPYIYPSRRALDVVSGQIRQTKPIRTVKFHAHVAFREIVEVRFHRARPTYGLPAKKGCGD